MTYRNRGAVLAALFAMAALAGPALIRPAAAQEKNDFKDEYNNILSSFGFARDHEAIDYTPRAPIVVPPTNDLPSPAAPTGRAAGFPDDPDVAARRKALVDPRQPVPLNDSGRSAKTRAYLIEPPAAYFDAAAVAATGKDVDRGDPAKPAPKHGHKHKVQADAAQ